MEVILLGSSNHQPSIQITQENIQKYLINPIHNETESHKNESNEIIENEKSDIKNKLIHMQTQAINPVLNYYSNPPFYLLKGRVGLIYKELGRVFGEEMANFNVITCPPSFFDYDTYIQTSKERKRAEDRKLWTLYHQLGNIIKEAKLGNFWGVVPSLTQRHPMSFENSTKVAWKNDFEFKGWYRGKYMRLVKWDRVPEEMGILRRQDVLHTYKKIDGPPRDTAQEKLIV